MTQIAKKDSASRLGRIALGGAAILIAFHAIEGATATEKPDAFPDPIERIIAGWTVEVDPRLLADENREVRERAFEALANHLQRVRYILPEGRVEALEKIRIRIDLDHPLGSMQYHPSAGWLEEHGYDPRLAKRVHIPRARDLYDRHMWAKHPYVVLHELAHAYHDQVLGFENEEIATLYRDARTKGIYEEVLLYTGDKVRHYGLNDPKEYFAEASEAYLGVNDFYPFVRAELREHDPAMFEYLEKVWGEVR